MKPGIFITGTGTGVGKTLASAILLRLLKAKKIDAVPMKPVQTGGSISIAQTITAPDLDFLLEASNICPTSEERELMAPYIFEPACSPHLAAKLANRAIKIEHIKLCAQRLAANHEFLLVEGAGGVFAPLAQNLLMIDLIAELGFRTIIVTSSELGTLNHSLLTIEALKLRGIPIAGLIVNDLKTLPSDDFIECDNCKFISEYSDLPILLRIPHLHSNTQQSILEFTDSIQQSSTTDILLDLLMETPELKDDFEIRQKDNKHLWHPFTDIRKFENAPNYTLIESASGVFLKDSKGNKILDGISSWWCMNLGHGHPRILSALQQSSRKLQQTILGGIAHKDAILLAEELTQVLPGNLNHIFFASDGSSAVEASLKIALQYWWNQGITNKTRFVHLDKSYHGDTLGAVSVGYVESFHRSIKDIIRKNFAAEAPHCTNFCPNGFSQIECQQKCFHSMEQLLIENKDEIAAVIVEPLCQAAGGMRIYSPQYLKKLEALCIELKILLIADEIATGFGRTGAIFACQHAEVVPDIMVLGKGLTSGFLPMSAVAVNATIYDTFRNSEDSPIKNKTFFHGHTFSGHPIAAACARATLKVFKEEGILEKMKPQVEQLSLIFEEISRGLPGSRYNSLGMIAMLEVPAELGGRDRAAKAAERARELGLMLRPLAEVLYLFPPLVSSEEEIEKMGRILKQAIVESVDN